MFAFGGDALGIPLRELRSRTSGHNLVVATIWSRLVVGEVGNTAGGAVTGAVMSDALAGSMAVAGIVLTDAVGADTVMSGPVVVGSVVVGAVVAGVMVMLSSS